MKSDFSFVLENAGWPALLVNAAGTVMRANQTAVRTFGAVLEAEAPSLSAVWSPENGPAAEQFLAQWERAPSAALSLRFRVKGAVTSVFSTSICSFVQNEQKYFILQLLPEPVAEKTHDTQLLQKQKLDCALQLARTVALDFNNALTSILGHTSLLLSQIEPTHPWRNSLLEVEKSASKAAEIANDLGTFSRQEKEPRVQQAGNLNSILQRSVEAFQKAEGQKTDWTLQFERKLFASKFDEAKLQQAFVKILENAVQAIGARAGQAPQGRITVQSRNIELAEPAQDRHARLAPGTYVCVEISDNGCGITPEVLPRIFEPFFTTKGGQHRGLGLAWVYGIVTNHGGVVAVSSQPEAGTSVRVYLPAQKKVVRDAGVSADDLTGTQTILMVDDEDLLLTMGQTVLSAFGYHVLTANSGQKALELLSQGEKIDLMITDLVMPAMSGRELLEHVRKVAPQMRVLCTSGFVRPAGTNDDSIYLQKPFTSQELLLKVKQALAGG